jgi:Uncharacterized protein conserved in bacteria
MLVKKESAGKFLYPPLIVSLLAAIVLIITTAFFETHFYPGTTVNGVKVSYMTAEEVDRKLLRWANSYVLILKERGGENEYIYGTEIGLKPDRKSEGAILKRKQNHTIWFLSFSKHDVLGIRNAFTYDGDLYKQRYGSLRCFDSSRVVPPQNAALVYSDGIYQVVREVDGNKVNEAKLYDDIARALRNGKTLLDLEKMKCYLNPAIRWDSPKVVNAKSIADHYITSKIIYPYAGGSEVVDRETINQWIVFDDELNVSFDSKKIKKYLYGLASDHYNTCGKERDFKTSYGKIIKVDGGDYGWKVDTGKETTELVDAIMRGKTIYKEPAYSQRGAKHDLNDIGSTYVEINLTKQHLWFYKDGRLVTQGDVVTGKMSSHKTPHGIYSLKYKVKNAVLKGVDYRTNVAYWMPFNNDIGIHDASWRTEFGRDIYVARGSHGCVNVSYRLAETLYNNIDAGTPIVCYY